MEKKLDQSSQNRLSKHINKYIGPICLIINVAKANLTTRTEYNCMLCQ